MPKNRQYYRKTKYPDKVAEPKSLVFVRIFLFCSVGIKIQYFPTSPKFQTAADRNRTGTGISTHGILSPGRLPVPPLRHKSDPNRTRTDDLRRDRAAL